MDIEKHNQEYNDFIGQETMKLDLSKPQLMAILNLTPDSFSDGGKWNNLEQIISGVGTMIEQGADIIDVGGESTRPGSQRVDAAEQKNTCGGYHHGNIGALS